MHPGCIPGVVQDNQPGDRVRFTGYVPEHLRVCVPTQEEIEKALVFKPLGIDGDALYEEAWSKFNAGG